MGLPILTPDDFVGEVKISTNEYTKKELMYYIDTYEKEILEELFGCEMSALIISNLDGSNIPVEPKYKVVWEEFCIDEDNICWHDSYSMYYRLNPEYDGFPPHRIQWKSKGVKEILKHIIYFMFTRDQPVNNTVTGNVKSQNSVSTMARASETNMRRAYNKAITWRNAIQWYIACKNPLNYDYSEFKGIHKKPIGLL